MTGFAINISHVEKAAKHVQEQIKSLTNQVAEEISEKGAVIAKETSGISKEKLAVLLALLSDRMFLNRDALVAYVGLDVAVRQSGTWRGKGKLSKRGNAYARKVLFQMAWGLKQHNQRYKEKYSALREKGKDYRT